MMRNSLFMRRGSLYDIRYSKHDISAWKVRVDQFLARKTLLVSLGFSEMWRYKNEPLLPL